MGNQDTGHPVETSLDGPVDFAALLGSSEPLHPDLRRYYREDGPLGPYLNHPLVQQIVGVRPGLANYQYAQKRAAVDRAYDENDWNRYVFLHERPWRLNAFMHIDGNATLDNETYWSLLGDIWTDSENIWQGLDVWRELLSADRPGRDHLMDDAERAAHAALLDTVIVYRGAARGVNEDGLSWTLDENRAHWFALRLRSEDEEPVVLRGTVAKGDVLAVFHGRGEDEVLVADSAAVAVQGAEEADPVRAARARG